MERLTEKITNKETSKNLAYRTLPNITNLKAIQQLGRYEDIGLTVEQVQQLAERDTAKRAIETSDETGIRYTDSYRCPNCSGNFTGTGIADFCYHCGQRLDWSE